jgi:DNA (cytosine-5)-methyltransferase 1
MHLFPYKWYLKDGYPSKNIQPNNYNVFGTFICGGGSTMGYKLAGFNHLGGVEIDPKIAKVYQLNHKPKHLFLEDIREFVKRSDIPQELYNLDLLDGSPPCSSFSMVGNREKDWGKKKVFKEGQAEQVLDDLFFEYIALAKKLQPKIVLAENVKGLIQGNAKLYVKKIFKAFDEAGYNVQLFLLNSASMGVPQKRERVFFICQRNDLNFPKLELKFNEDAIPFGNVRSEKGNTKSLTERQIKTLSYLTTEKTLEQIEIKHFGKGSGFTDNVVHDSDVAPTITSGGKQFRAIDKSWFSDCDFQVCGTYPLDYDFQDVEPKYLIGMSVPPVMTAQIANQIKLQWLDKTTNKQRNGRL